MSKITIPKHTAKIEDFMGPLEIFYKARVWVSSTDFTDRLYAYFVEIGKEAKRHWDNTHYTKCAQLPSYFGLLESKEFKPDAEKRITERGRKWYEAYKVKDFKAVYSLIVDALSTMTFGRNNIGAIRSDSDFEVLNILIRGIILLNGMTKREYAVVLQKVIEEDVSFIDVLTQLIGLRATGKEPSIDSVENKYTDVKPFTFLCNLGFFEGDADGKMRLSPLISRSDMMRLCQLKISHPKVGGASVENGNASSDERAGIISSVSDDEEKINLDRLSLSLQIFKSARGEDKWQTCRDGYKDINVGPREYYDVVTADEILNFDSESFNQFLIKHSWMGQNGKAYPAIQKAITNIGNCNLHKKFVAELKTNPRFPSEYWTGEHLGGIGHSLISELLMKFHPSDYAMYNSKTHDALTFLGLIEGRFESDFTAEQYSRVLGIQAMIRQKMKEMKIQSRLEENSPDADFLTVNEFLYYVATNQQFIKEEMMKEQLKSVTRVKRQGERDLNSSDELMIRLMSALRTKPFAILAGHSGTGKSRMVRRLAYMTCRDERLLNGDNPGNFCMVQVKPNWHDSTDLLGYYSALEKKYKPTDFLKFICKAYAYPDVPFFVCLDEMNLAPVEQYFAECLSAMETGKMKNGEFVTDSLISRDIDAADLELKFTESKTWLDNHGLTIPRNLFVVGTVNMDETTCQFSRKVLDRAMTIEMNEIKFEDFGKKNDEPGEDDLLKDEKINTLLNGKTKAAALSERQIDLLNKLKDILESTPFVVAYRFANEYALYAEALKEFGGKDESEAFDHAVLMKVLPRIAGEYDAVKGIFEGEAKGATGKKKMGLMSLFLEGGSNGNQSRSLSCAKMREILARNESYLSFWP